jgi:LmbE family N-acetylglucosaminyl deacetylase
MDAITTDFGEVLLWSFWFFIWIAALMEAYSRQRVEQQSDGGGNRRGEALEGAPVVGVEDPPGLQVGDDSFDYSSSSVDCGVEVFLPVEKPALRDLLDRRDHASAQG